MTAERQVAAVPSRSAPIAAMPGRHDDDLAPSTAGVNRASSRRRRVQHAVLLSLVSYVLVTLVWTGVGFLIKSGPVAAVRSSDARVAQAMVGHRTPRLDDLAFYVAHSADTLVKIGATAVLAALFWLVWRRWTEAALVAWSLVLEAAVFMTVTTIVRRPRPEVPRLEDSPVGSSFPSGHTAAAAVYSALAVVLFWHTRNRFARSLAVVLALAMPALVGLVRVYQGMHHVTDTVFGALLGFTTVLVVAGIVGRPEEPAETGPVER